MGEWEERNEEIQNFLIRSTKFHWSEFVKPRVKFYLLDKGYAYVPKSKDFIEDPKMEIWGNQIFWALEVFSRPHSILLCFKR